MVWFLPPISRELVYWDMRVGEIFKRVIEKNVTIPQLADMIVSFFIRLWVDGVKVSRASFALRVFPDISMSELEEMCIVDAYTNILDDFVDCYSIDAARGKNVSKIYTRTILVANGLFRSWECKYAINFLAGHKIFDYEYKLRLMFAECVSPTSLEDAVSLLEKLYLNEAYDIWYFFAYPAHRRLSLKKAECLIKASLIFGALWLILDHLVDLDEDRKNNVITGVRFAIDYLKQPITIKILVDRLRDKFNKLFSESDYTVYMERLKDECLVLISHLDEEIERLLSYKDRQ